MNYKKFQELPPLLVENIFKLSTDDREKLLLKCINTINTAYKDKKDFVVSEFNRYTIIGFKGTNNLSDWQTDLNYSIKEKLHRGFMLRANKIDISNYLDNNNIILTGHSLGAAIAFFKFIETRNNPKFAKNIKMLICFGMPRPGHNPEANTLLTNALAVDPPLDAEKSTHFVVLKDKGRVDPVSTLPSKYSEVAPSNINLIDFYSAKSPGWSKFLELYLHQLDSYRDSLSTYLKSHQK